ncbi:MAG: HAD family hydrolase [Defluviitaleaceae bacterium]|nr:HAD family hydrolase [Defluviitaleaceae bacterium]
MKLQNSAIFLDRDGTINIDTGYTWNVSDLMFIKNVPQALKKLKDAGFLLIVVTNQSGVARGYCTLSDVKQFNDALNCRLKTLENTSIDAFYICPHLPYPLGTVLPYSIDCDCRKPKPGLIYKAGKDYNIDFLSSYLIGDKKSDIDIGLSIKFKRVFQVGSAFTIADLADEIIRN